MVEIGQKNPSEPDADFGLFSIGCGSFPGSWLPILGGETPKPNPVQVAMELIVAMHEALPALLDIVEDVAAIDPSHKIYEELYHCKFCTGMNVANDKIVWEVRHSDECAWLAARALVGDQ